MCGNDGVLIVGAPIASSFDWMSLSFALSSFSSRLCLSTSSLSQFHAASPQAASMRRTPDAMAPSDLILKMPMSVVLLTWVPPQSSME